MTEARRDLGLHLSDQHRQQQQEHGAVNSKARMARLSLGPFEVLKMLLDGCYPDQTKTQKW